MSEELVFRMQGKAQDVFPELDRLDKAGMTLQEASAILNNRIEAIHTIAEIIAKTSIQSRQRIRWATGSPWLTIPPCPRYQKKLKENVN